MLSCLVTGVSTHDAAAVFPHWTQDFAPRLHLPRTQSINKPKLIQQKKLSDFSSKFCTIFTNVHYISCQYMQRTGLTHSEGKMILLLSQHTWLFSVERASWLPLTLGFVHQCHAPRDTWRGRRIRKPIKVSMKILIIVKALTIRSNINWRVSACNLFSTTSMTTLICSPNPTFNSRNELCDITTKFENLLPWSAAESKSWVIRTSTLPALHNSLGKVVYLEQYKTELKCWTMHIIWRVSIRRRFRKKQYLPHCRLCTPEASCWQEPLATPSHPLPMPEPFPVTKCTVVTIKYNYSAMDVVPGKEIMHGRRSEINSYHKWKSWRLCTVDI